jgi:3-phosphoglycerate kinase
MKPLTKEFELFLQTPVRFLDEPCSGISRMTVDEAEPGTVFLLENLKFYPAEEGADDEDHGYEDERDNPSTTSLTTMGSTSKRRENIDKEMYEHMAYKSVEQYTRGIGDLADIYINDDVTSILRNSTSTSSRGFDMTTRAAGLAMLQFLKDKQGDSEVFKTVGLQSLTPSQKKE